MSDKRLAMTGPTREAEDNKDYEDMSGSVMNLAILGAMMVLGELAADFAKAVFAEIKGIFLPESAEPAAAGAKLPHGPTEGAPPPRGGPKSDVPTPGEGVRGAEAPRTPEVKGEKPTTDTPENRTPESDSPAPADEIANSKQAASKALENPENIHPVKDPAYSGQYDVEVEADGHTFRRDRERGTWCRFTAKECGIDLGPKASGAADAAAADQAAGLLKRAATPKEVASFIKEVADRTGRNPAEVDRFLRLANQMGPDAEALAESITKAVQEGKRLPNGAREQLGDMLDRLNNPKRKGDRALGSEANKQYVDPLTGEPLVPGEPAHRAQRWAEYQQREGLTPKEAAERKPGWDREYDQAIENQAKGSAAEQDALARAKVKKNNGALLDPTKPGEPFIPDGVRGDPAKLTQGQPYDFVEVKYWEYLSQTGNVLRMLKYIEKFGGTLELWVSKGTEFSGPLELLIDSLNAKKPGTVTIKTFTVK
jgi:hypothetical protein